MSFGDICLIAFTLCMWILRVSVAVGLIIAGVYLVNAGFIVIAVMAFFIALTFILYWLVFLFTEWE